MATQRISEIAGNYKTVLDGLIETMNDVGSGKMSVDQGEVRAKAGYAAVKALEGDLRARVFEYKLERAVPAMAKKTAGQIKAA